MRRDYMDSITLRSQFQQATTASWAQESTSSPLQFIRACREGQQEEVQRSLKYISGDHLSSGLSGAVEHGQHHIAEILMRHVKPKQHHFASAIKTDDVEMLSILNQNDVIKENFLKAETTSELLRIAALSNAPNAIHFLISQGYKIDTSAQGNIRTAGMHGHKDALEALLQHVTIVDPDCTSDIQASHRSCSHVTDLLNMLETKKTFLDTLNKYQYYQKHQGTAPARPSNQKVKDFAANSIASMISRHTPVLTQDAIDDFHENKYKKKKATPKRDRHIPGANFFGGCL